MHTDHSPASASKLLFKTVILESHADLAPFVALRHQQLLIKRGLVISANLYKAGTLKKLYLLLITRYLVVDLVS